MKTFSLRSSFAFTTALAVLSPNASDKMLGQFSFDQWTKIVETAAIIIGGFWTLYKFNALQEKRTVELDNRLKLEDLLSHQPNLTMNIKVEEIPWKEGTFCSFLSVLVTIKNEGDQNAYVGFRKGALTVGRIIQDKSGHVSVREVRLFPTFVFREDSSKLEPLILKGSLPDNDRNKSAEDVRIFRAGQERQIAFAVPITELGGYFIQFSCIYKRRPFDAEMNQDEETESLNEGTESQDEGTEAASRTADSKKSAPIHSMQQTIFFATGGVRESVSKSAGERQIVAT
jgi:hypothetical protein